jgi:hypothetical protein
MLLEPKMVLEIVSCDTGCGIPQQLMTKNL